jgi:hypothetical protein
MKIEATPAVVVDLRDTARPRLERESIDRPARAADKLSSKAAPEVSRDRVALWYAGLDIAGGLEGMYYCG